MTRLWSDGCAVATRGEGETPASFLWAGVSHRIAKIHDRWRIHTRWWQPATPAVRREYLKVTTDTGLLCLLYHEPQASAGFLARVYD